MRVPRCKFSRCWQVACVGIAGVLASCGPWFLWGGSKELRERLTRMERSVRRLKEQAGPSDQRWLLEEAEALLQQAQKALEAGQEYVSDQLCDAADDALDAIRHLRKARSIRGQPSRGDRDRRETARDLEQAYFAIRQGEYFAERLKGNAQRYVELARRLYQEARSAYDQGELAQASELAEAIEEIIGVLDNLAQARSLEPPRL